MGINEQIKNFSFDKRLIAHSCRHYLDDQRIVMPRYANEPGVYGDGIFSSDMVLRMPIFTGGRIKNEIKSADLLRQSAQHRLARTRQELVFNVSHVFYNILAQAHVIESLAFSKKAMEEHHKRVSDLVNVQKAARVDLLRTDVRLAAQTTYYNALADYNSAVAQWHLAVDGLGQMLRWLLAKEKTVIEPT